MLRTVVGFPRRARRSLVRSSLVPALAAATVTTVRQVGSRLLKILDTATFAFFLFVLVGGIGFPWMVPGVATSAGRRRKTRRRFILKRAICKISAATC